MRDGYSRSRNLHFNLQEKSRRVDASRNLSPAKRMKGERGGLRDKLKDRIG